MITSAFSNDTPFSKQNHYRLDIRSDLNSLTRIMNETNEFFTTIRYRGKRIPFCVIVNRIKRDHVERDTWSKPSTESLTYIFFLDTFFTNTIFSAR